MCSASKTEPDSLRPQPNHCVVLSLGSNQGDRLGWLKQAGLELLALPETRCLAFSPVYETDPVGVPHPYRDLHYLNCVVLVETRLSAQVFSDAIHAIEDRFGRSRGETAGLPRAIDIDIIAFGTHQSDAADLTLPHPRASGRRFVLQPLADLCPDFVIPGETRTVAELLRALPPEPKVRRYGDPKEKTPG